MQNKFQCMHFPSFIPIILYNTSITPFILAFKLNGTRFLSASINLQCTHVSIMEATITDRTASPSSVFCNHKASWYCYHRTCQKILYSAWPVQDKPHHSKILLKGELKWRRTSQALSTGIEQKLADFHLEFLNLKIHVWKLWKHNPECCQCAQQGKIVTSWTRLACMPKVFNI